MKAKPDAVTIRVDTLLQQMITILTKAAPVRKIILYGSRARGTALPESDIDLMVVEKGYPNKLEEQRRLRRLMPDAPIWIDLWVMGEEEFEETRNIIGGMAYPANKYGKVIYEET